MNFSSVLVVTYGRSGSTLLQGLLNSIDGCVVRGENYNFCLGLFGAYQALRAASSRYGEKELSRSPTFPWFGSDRLDADVFLEDARKLVMNQLLPLDRARGKVQCFGFKEIRYLPEQLGSRNVKLPDYLDFLSKLFPLPAFIFLTRDHAQVVQSGLWKSRDAVRAERYLREFDLAVEEYGKDKTWTFHVTYEDIVSKSPRLKAMFEFLGAPYDTATIESVLAEKHGAFRRGGERPTSEARNFRIELEPTPLVEHVDLDRSPISITNGASFALGGVVVLNSSEAGAKYSLLANDAAGAHRPKWGKRSPALRKRFPGNPAAASARFSVEGLQISDETPLTLSLVNDNGDLHVLARMTLEEDSAEDAFGVTEEP